MKVLICDSVADEALAKMKAAGLDVTVKTGMKEDELVKTVPGFDAIVVRSATKVTAPVVQAMDKMKVIVRGGVGLDNIDQAAAKAKNIKVLNTPTASSASVAELTIGHMFGLARFIPHATCAIRGGGWPKKEMKGIELFGKTLGVIGIGKIGAEVAWRAHALGMKVIAFDQYIKQSPLPSVVTMVSKDDLLARSDFITLHIPFDKQFGATLKSEDFAKMKKGVFIVNCARGGTVDEKALLEALNSGTVTRVALDVFEKEPPVENALANHPNVYSTPHIGASTVEGQFRVGMEVADLLINEAKG